VPHDSPGSSFAVAAHDSDDGRTVVADAAVAADDNGTDD